MRITWVVSPRCGRCWTPGAAAAHQPGSWQTCDCWGWWWFAQSTQGGQKPKIRISQSSSLSQWRCQAPATSSTTWVRRAALLSHLKPSYRKESGGRPDFWIRSLTPECHRGWDPWGMRGLCVPAVNSHEPQQQRLTKGFMFSLLAAKMRAASPKGREWLHSL